VLAEIIDQEPGLFSATFYFNYASTFF
jgi:hypothetical protein